MKADNRGILYFSVCVDTGLFRYITASFSLSSTLQRAEMSAGYILPSRSNLHFLFLDIRALWRSALSARVPECQKLKM